MNKNKTTSFEEFEAGLLQDSEIQKEYDALKPKYEMIQNIIKLLSSAKEVKCEHCGAEPPDLSEIRGKSLVKCKFCSLYYRPPLWISTLENS